MILDEIVRDKKISLEYAKSLWPLQDLKRRIKDTPDAKNFERAIAFKGGDKDSIRIIAEVKRASPSKGMIRQNFLPYDIARGYELAGAAAVSILTEEKYFMGKLDYILAARGNLKVPILRKDFIFDEYQVYESRAAGSDAILLIAAILKKEELKGLLDLSSSLGMGTLVEVHDEAELELVMNTGAKIIGVNNRDLKTFKTDINTTIRLAAYIPQDRVLVSESGINTFEDIMTLKHSGVEAFLIGEALMREEDYSRKLRKLRGDTSQNMRHYRT